MSELDLEGYKDKEILCQGIHVFMEKTGGINESFEQLLNSTIISAVLTYMNKKGVTTEAFFADEPEWTVYETKE